MNKKKKKLSKAKGKALVAKTIKGLKALPKERQLVLVEDMLAKMEARRKAERRTP